LPPRIAFCTTCKGRTQHLEQTLPRNLKDNEDYGNAVFVLVNYNSSDHFNRYLRDNYWREIEIGRLVVYNFTEPTNFKMAHAKNLSHRLGIREGAEILVNLDADNFTGSRCAERISVIFEEKAVFAWAGVVKGRGRRYRGCGGRIVVSTHSFLNAGGYDEKFETWSPDDKDFTARLCRLGYKAREIGYDYLESIPHNNFVRFQEYPEAQAEIDENIVYRSDSTIVNHGNAGCGVVFRNFGADPIELMPFPTRVFGIGMHKTATTSLNQALKILGLDSAHWECPGRAKAIWNEIKAGKSLTVEHHYCASDLPISILYRELDQAYPNSKFILTVRSEEKWIESVKNHWDVNRNPYRDTWDGDGITNRIHKAAYGQTTFDSEVFLARYRRHNAEVKEYFKGRRDLLVMDMDSGAGWQQLCGFLRKRIPDVEYPRQFVTV
jgi:hypothetical protein